ncbi:hypothetical protein [Burkholderia seminalis]|nr:hypothetical protein [Burkholderia seminalis]MDN7591334.1 hypothetical protein [Burkholderia seminalis]
MDRRLTQVGLGASTVVRLDGVKDAQRVPNLQAPLKTFDTPGMLR